MGSRIESNILEKSLHGKGLRLTRDWHSNNDIVSDKRDMLTSQTNGSLNKAFHGKCDSSSSFKVSQYETDNSSTSIGSTTWICDTCTYENQKDKLCCDMCASQKPSLSVKQPNIWICDNCTLVNEIISNTCDACGSVQSMAGDINDPRSNKVGNPSERKNLSASKKENLNNQTLNNRFESQAISLIDDSESDDDKKGTTKYSRDEYSDILSSESEDMIEDDSDLMSDDNNDILQAYKEVQSYSSKPSALFLEPSYPHLSKHFR